MLAATLADAWQVLTEIVARAGGDPGWPGLAGPTSLPSRRTPRTVAVLETPGWSDASEAAKAALHEACTALAAGGVSVLHRFDRPEIEAVERAIAETQRLTRVINTWESRWPTNIYRERDAAKLSQHMHQRLKEAEGMTVDDYRDALRRRAEVRRTYEALSGVADLCITLAASGAAPIGIESTGNPAFAAPSSLLGVPALSLPLLEDESLPLGLQALGLRAARRRPVRLRARDRGSCVRPRALRNSSVRSPGLHRRSQRIIGGRKIRHVVPRPRAEHVRERASLSAITTEQDDPPVEIIFRQRKLLQGPRDHVIDRHVERYRQGCPARTRRTTGRRISPRSGRPCRPAGTRQARSRSDHPARAIPEFRAGSAARW